MEEFRYSVTMNIMVAVSSAPHIIFFLASFKPEFFPFMYLNLFSIFMYVIAYFFNRFNMFKTSVAIICSELAIFSLFSVAFFGFNSDFQWYILLALVPLFLFVDTSGIQRVLTTILLFICLLAVIYIDKYGTPLYKGQIVFFNRILNVNLVFWGIVFEITLSKLVKGIVDNIGATNMEKIKMESLLDPLTGLYNRRYAEKFFTELQEEKKPVQTNKYVFAMLDIDDFKKINDKYGHAVGDAALKKLAKLLKNNLRSTDMIARWGGEEFLIVLSGLKISQAKVLMDKIRIKIENQEIILDNQILKYTVTIGLAALEKDNISGAIEHCDSNLYFGKHHGKNRVIA